MRIAYYRLSARTRGDQKFRPDTAEKKAAVALWVAE
jgi:hypothetical protein